MKRDRLFRIAGVSAVMLSFFLSGCGSSRPAKFYTLHPVKSIPAAAKQTVLSDPPVTVGIGPIEIPDYLDRPQIVTRTAQNELAQAEFERWAGSLKTDIARVLVENLSVLLPPDQVSVVPWTRGGPLQYRVAVDVTRFDVTPGENVWLKAR